MGSKVHNCILLLSNARASIMPIQKKRKLNRSRVKSFVLKYYFKPLEYLKISFYIKFGVSQDKKCYFIQLLYIYMYMFLIWIFIWKNIAVTWIVYAVSATQLFDCVLNQRCSRKNCFLLCIYVIYVIYY
jgi:hypothetical protein